MKFSYRHVLGAVLLLAVAVSLQYEWSSVRNYLPAAFTGSGRHLVTWDGGGSTNNWPDDDNWDGNLEPDSDDVVAFNGTSSKNCTIDVSITLEKLQIGETVDTITANAYTGIVTQASGVTMTVGVFRMGAGTFVGGDSAMNITGGSGSDLYVFGGGNLTFTSGTTTINDDFSVCCDATIGTNNVQSTGTIVFSSADQSNFYTQNALTLNNVTFQKTEGMAFNPSNANLVIAGNAIFNNTKYIDCTAGAGDCSPTPPIIEVRGDLTVGANYPTTTTYYVDLKFTGSNAQTVTINSSNLAGFFPSIEVNKTNNTDTVTLATDLSLNRTGHNLAITKGTFRTHGYTLAVNDQFTVAANGTLGLHGDEASVATIDTLSSGSTILYYDTAGTHTLANYDYTANAVNLTINGSGAVYQLGAAETIGGVLTVTAGTLDANDQTLSMNGNTTINGGTLMTGTNTVTFGDAGADSVTISSGTLQIESNANADIVKNATTWTNSGGTISYTGASVTIDLLSSLSPYNNLTINGTSSTFSSNGTIQVDGTATVTAGTLDANDQTLTLNGNVVIDGGTFKSGTGVVTYGNAGADSVTISSGALEMEQDGDSDFVKNAGTWANSGGTIIYNAGALFTLALPTSISPYNHLTINSASGSTYRSNGNFTVNGNTVITAGTLDVSFNGNKITNTGNLTINGAAGILAASSGDIDLDGNLVITNGRLDAPTAADDTSFTIAGSWEVSASGNFAESTGRVIFDGTANGKTIVTTSSSESNDDFNVLKVTGNGGVWTLQDAVELGNDFAISNGTLDANGQTMTIVGNWTHSGGTFTSGANTVTFTGGGSKTLTTGGIGDGQDFNHLTIDKSGGTLTVQTNAVDVDGNFTITNGTFDSNALDITVAGNWANSATYTSGANTVTFDGAADQTITTNASAFNNLTLNNTGASGSDDLVISGALDVDGTLTITDGDLDLFVNNPAVDTSGAVTIGASGSVTKGTGIWTFSGASSNLNANNQNLGAVTVNGASKTLTLTGALQTQNVIIGADDILALAGQNLTANGALTNNNILRLQGNETTVSFTAMDTASGTVEYVGRNQAETLTIKDFTTTDYFNLTINDANVTKATFQPTAALAVAGALNVTSGTLSANANTVTVTGLTTVNGGTYQSSTATQTFNGGLTVSSGTFTGAAGTVDVNGVFTHSSGTFTAPTSLTVSGNFARTGGTFTQGAGTVTLDGTNQTISGSTTFNNLTKSVAAAATLTFTAGTTQTIGGALVLNGAAAQLLTLASNVPTTAWNLAPAGTVTVSYLSISDSIVTPAVSCTTGCFEGTGNTGWTFTVAGGARRRVSVCGDARVELTEQCDDGNTLSGDGCSASCVVEPKNEFFAAAPEEEIKPGEAVQVGQKEMTIHYGDREIIFTKPIRIQMRLNERGVAQVAIKGRDGQETFSLEKGLHELVTNLFDGFRIRIFSDITERLVETLQKSSAPEKDSIAEMDSEDEFSSDSELAEEDASISDIFTDIAGDPEREAILALRNFGIVQGYPDNTYHPEWFVNRAQTSKIIALAAGISPDAAKQGDEWYSALQRSLVKLGIVNGNIDPASSEARANFLAILLKARGIDPSFLPACTAKRFTDVPLESWYCPAVEYAFQKGWIREKSGAFSPAEEVDRSTVAGWVYRAFTTLVE